VAIKSILCDLPKIFASKASTSETGIPLPGLIPRAVSPTILEGIYVLRGWSPADFPEVQWVLLGFC